MASRFRRGRRPSSEEGQAAGEYALIAAVATLALFGFLPFALRMYAAYVKGFYLLLSCPFP